MRYWATHQHYADHIAPVLAELGDIKQQRAGKDPVIVAGYIDLHTTTGPAIYMEHGAGQTYGRGLAGYAGGSNRERVALFLCPSERVAELNRAAYPHTPSVAVGCPRLDPWLPPRPRPGDGVVGVAFHWNAQVSPEARSALPHYRDLASLAERFQVIGTAHPRMMRTAAKVYANAGIEVVSSDEMFERAEVLCVDNSSIGWEFLALDRPVVWMNAPWYRRGVHHGLRFWDMADIQVDGPEELPAAIEEALADPPERRARRHEIAEMVYAYRDGRSAQRAADAIREVFDR